MASIQLQGTIAHIGATEVVGTKGFQKRDCVIEIDQSTQYPQKILLQFTGDKCNLLNLYGEGQEVICDVNVRGREWTSPQGEVKYFNTLEAWRINAVASGLRPQAQAPTQAAAPNPFSQPTQAPVAAPELFDDLPF